MTELKPDQFEMRRLESLSNTIFGVAMTLLAYDLPKAAVFTSAPAGAISPKSIPASSPALRSVSSSPACSGLAITGGWRASPSGPAVE